MSATETVNFWVEYIVRNGPNTLKSPALDLYWWQIALLDVYGCLLLCGLAIIYFLLFIVKFLLQRIFLHSSQDLKKIKLS